jgi:hypothetical protein
VQGKKDEMKAEENNNDDDGRGDGIMNDDATCKG